jgi:hypothetical protein
MSPCDQLPRSLYHSSYYFVGLLLAGNRRGGVEAISLIVFLTLQSGVTLTFAQSVVAVFERIITPGQM